MCNVQTERESMGGNMSGVEKLREGICLGEKKATRGNMFGVSKMTGGIISGWNLRDPMNLY